MIEKWKVNIIKKPYLFLIPWPETGLLRWSIEVNRMVCYKYVWAKCTQTISIQIICQKWHSSTLFLKRLWRVSVLSLPKTVEMPVNFNLHSYHTVFCVPYIIYFPNDFPLFEKKMEFYHRLQSSISRTVQCFTTSAIMSLNPFTFLHGILNMYSICMSVHISFT